MSFANFGHRIHTARTLFGVADLTYWWAWNVNQATNMRQPDAGRIPRPEGEAIDESLAPAYAFVSGGVWIADCPDGCGCASAVEPGWPYMCAYCCNRASGYRWRPVRWPKAKDVVESLLLERPFEHVRNYLPHMRDTVASLRRENRNKPWTALPDHAVPKGY